MTGDDLLGCGAHAVVHEGSFRGLKVAVKCIQAGDDETGGWVGGDFTSLM
jgi:hypothetical protein